MPIRFKCPQCQTAYAVPEGKAGRRARCRCGALVDIPGPTSAGQPQAQRPDVPRGQATPKPATAPVRISYARSDYPAWGRGQSELLQRLRSISKKQAQAIFGELGVPSPNEYSDGDDVFSMFRSACISALSSLPAAEVRAWFLPTEPSSGAADVLYMHLDHRVIPTGVAVCRLDSGGFLAWYDDFRQKLGLGK